jgi:Type ISP C-terminal specificity domain
VAIPFNIKPEKPEADGHYGLIKAREDVATEPFANLSKNARGYLKGLGLANPDSNSNVAPLIWLHSLAIGYSPLYLKENNCGIRYNWPRFPMPADKKALQKSAELGDSVSQLLDTEAEVKGVTSGTLRPEMKAIGNLNLVSAKHVDPEKHLKIDVGWGHEGKEGITMGGKGQIATRPYSDPERKAIEEGAATYGLSVEQAIAQLGEETTDVYLNDSVYWKNVPTRAWDFTIGGYQVLKKWLSYRETKLLGRVLTTDEAYYFRDMVRRIASLCLLEPTLDANYTSVKASTYAWPAPVIHTKPPGPSSGSSK